MNLPSLVNVHWFPSSRTNFTLPFLHAARKHKQKTAILSLSENPTARSELTFGQLHDRVIAVSSGLFKCGIRAGASIGAVVSTNEHAVIALLSTTLIGCVFASCSPDFGIDAIVSRLQQLQISVLFFSPIYYFKGKKYDIRSKIHGVCQRLPSIKVIVSDHPHFVISTPQLETPFMQFTLAGLQRLGQQSLDRNEVALNDIQALISMRDPAVVMFSSGTTGRPKCLVQGVGILLNQMKEHLLHFDIDSSTESRLLYVTSTSWMMFNWSLAALALGAQIVLYDGSPQLPNDPVYLLRLVIRERVTHFGAGASLIRAFAQAVNGCSSHTALGKHAVHLKSVLATGSSSTAEHFAFVKAFFPRRVRYMSMSGGTDINGCFVLGTPWKPIHVSEIQCAGLSMDIQILDLNQKRLINSTGELCIRNACPCQPLYFLNDTGNCDRYRESYFQLYGDTIWNHGDFALESEHASFVISGRSDATLNQNGVRIGTAEIYNVVEHHVDFIVDSIVVDVPLVASTSSVIVLFVVLSQQTGSLNRGHVRKIKQTIRAKVSPRHVPKIVLQVQHIPTTWSGKKCETSVKNLLMGKDVTNKGAVKNPESFDEIARVFKQFLSLRRTSKL